MSALLYLIQTAHGLFLLFTAVEFFVQKLYAYSYGIQRSRKAEEKASSTLAI